MSKPNSKNELSQEGKARKASMLGQLQDELVSLHRRRRQRARVVKVASLMAIAVIAGLAWSFLLPTPDTGNRIAEGTTTTSPTLRTLITSVGNVAGIDDRCVVENSDSSATFEAMADDELLAMLAAVGKPSVLGEINGKVRVIPDSAPIRKEVKAL